MKRFTYMITCTLLFCLFPWSCLGKENKDAVGSSTEGYYSKLTDEEKYWYQKFQDGILFFEGWKQISHDILDRFPANDRIQIKENLMSLGKKIGFEWCKDNAIRKIDTDMLKKWGKMLERAVNQGKNHVAETIEYVEKEVDKILHKQLTDPKKES